MHIDKGNKRVKGQHTELEKKKLCQIFICQMTDIQII
jgi:hypothetical protein